jgi:hypothetical protein
MGTSLALIRDITRNSSLKKRIMNLPPAAIPRVEENLALAEKIISAPEMKYLIRDFQAEFAIMKWQLKCPISSSGNLRISVNRKYLEDMEPGDIKVIDRGHYDMGINFLALSDVFSDDNVKLIRKRMERPTAELSYSYVIKQIVRPGPITFQSDCDIRDAGVDDAITFFENVKESGMYAQKEFPNNATLAGCVFSRNLLDIMHMTWQNELGFASDRQLLEAATNHDLTTLLEMQGLSCTPLSPWSLISSMRKVLAGLRSRIDMNDPVKVIEDLKKTQRYEIFSGSCHDYDLRDSDPSVQPLESVIYKKLLEWTGDGNQLRLDGVNKVLGYFSFYLMLSRPENKTIGSAVDGRIDKLTDLIRIYNAVFGLAFPGSYRFGSDGKEIDERSMVLSNHLPEAVPILMPDILGDACERVDAIEEKGYQILRELSGGLDFRKDHFFCSATFDLMKQLKRFELRDLVSGLNDVVAANIAVQKDRKPANAEAFAALEEIRKEIALGSVATPEYLKKANKGLL